jgi:hypothetical protein
MGQFSMEISCATGSVPSGNQHSNETSREAPPLPVDERIDFIASAEGRRLIAGLMMLPPRVRGRVAAVIAALGEELAEFDANRDIAAAGEAIPADRKTA